MYAVGKVGTFFAQGVYTVSGPFHPFGGAVDIIVVQQEDGTFKSSPWYVKFGKFQGVLKRREKKVAVAVNNDGDANFHMYLDHKGEAYFLKDAQGDEVATFSPTEAASSGDENSSHMLALEYPRAEEGANLRAADLGKEESEDEKGDDLELRFEGRDASKQLIQQSVDERAAAARLVREEINIAQEDSSGDLKIRQSPSADEAPGCTQDHHPDSQPKSPEAPEAGRKTESSNGKVMHALLNKAVDLEAGVKSTPATAVLANAALTALHQSSSLADDDSVSLREAVKASTKVRRTASNNGTIIHGLLNQAIGLQPSHKSGPATGLIAAAVLASLQKAISSNTLHKHVELIELDDGADLDAEKNHQDASPGSPVAELKEALPALDSASNPNAAYSLASNGNTADDVMVMKTVSSLGSLSGSDFDQPDGELPIRSDPIAPPRNAHFFDVMKTLEVRKVEILDQTLVVEVQEHVEKETLGSVGSEEEKDIVDVEGRVEIIVVDRKEVMEKVHDLQGRSPVGGIPNRDAQDPESLEDKRYEEVNKLVSVHVDKRFVENLQKVLSPKIGGEGPKPILEKEKDISTSAGKDDSITNSENAQNAETAQNAQNAQNTQNAQNARIPEVAAVGQDIPLDSDRAPSTNLDGVRGDTIQEVPASSGKELALVTVPVKPSEVSSPRMKAAVELELAWRDVIEKAGTTLKGAPYTTTSSKRLSHSQSNKKKSIDNDEKKKPDSQGRLPQQQSERKSWGGWLWGGNSAPQAKRTDEQGSSKDGKTELGIEHLDLGNNNNTELRDPSGVTSELENDAKAGTTRPRHEGSDNNNAEAEERRAQSEIASGPAVGVKAEEHHSDTVEQKSSGGPPPPRRSWIGLLSRTNTNQSSLSSTSSLRSNEDDLQPIFDGLKRETSLERAENVVDLLDDTWAKGSESHRARVLAGKMTKHEPHGTAEAGEASKGSSGGGAASKRVDGTGSLVSPSAHSEDSLKSDSSSVVETPGTGTAVAQLETPKSDAGTVEDVENVRGEDDNENQQLIKVTTNGSDVVSALTSTVSDSNVADLTTSNSDADVLLLRVGGHLVRAPVGLGRDDEAPLSADDSKSNQAPLLPEDKPHEAPLSADDNKSNQAPLLPEDKPHEAPLLADDKSYEGPLLADDKFNEARLLADDKSNEIPLLSDNSVKTKRGAISPHKLVCFAAVPDEKPDTQDLPGNLVPQTREGTGTQLSDPALEESDGHVLLDLGDGKMANPGSDGLKGLAKLIENDSGGAGQAKGGSLKRLATEIPPDELRGRHSETGETPKPDGNDDSESGVEMDAADSKEEFDDKRAMVFDKLEEPVDEGDGVPEEDPDEGQMERYYSSKDLTEAEVEQDKRAFKLKRNLSVYMDAISGEDELDSGGSVHEDDLDNPSRDRSGPIGIPGAQDRAAQTFPSEDAHLLRSASESLPNSRSNLLVNSEMVSPRLLLSRSLDSVHTPPSAIISPETRQNNASSDGVLTARPSGRSPVSGLQKGLVEPFVAERSPEKDKEDPEQPQTGGMFKPGTQGSAAAASSSSSSSSIDDGRKAPETGFELSLCRHLLKERMGLEAAAEAFTTEKITLDEFKKSGSSIAANDKLVVKVGGRYYPWAVAAPIVIGILAFGQVLVAPDEGAIAVEQSIVVFDGKAAENTATTISGGGWKIWPFGAIRRPKTPERGVLATREAMMVATEAALKSSVTAEYLRMAGYYKRPRKVRTNSPSSQQLASLNLKEGSNKITFTFETRVWGKQQVDARIYLWRWNTRIVVSDVDGTITKSDVLGQVMPLMGKDWTQIGVARLFSAIKKNGYELMFLSARAISQAYLTRQFLENIKQDGEALPDGPVVISPDGLFPSLYREVIRRAPHEFKIACLEDIKSLFPPESKPFYAGFGNRDTDELSYLKVGISKGKIFIINPKGEVVVNNQVDVKSYTSLHKLVDDMFPAMSFTEQEDYNEWNFWKLPLPDVDDEPSLRSFSGSTSSRRSASKSGRRS